MATKVNSSDVISLCEVLNMEIISNQALIDTEDIGTVLSIRSPIDVQLPGIYMMQLRCCVIY